MRRLADAAETWSRPRRSRLGHQVFLGEQTKLLDRVVTSAYFSLFSWTWADLGEEPGHLVPFEAALQALPDGMKPVKVADVGVGAGRSTALLAQRFPTAEVIGFDLSRRMVREARRHQHPNLRFRRADGRRLPLADADLDLVTCVNAVMPPPEGARVLRPGGVLITASTWFPPRDENSDWIRRFRSAGFDLVAQGASEQGSWEVWRLPRTDSVS